MKLSRQEEITQPFVLTSDDLNKVYANLQKWLSMINFDISCKDSLDREFSTLEDLLQFENPPQKDIRSFCLRGYSHDHQTRASIYFNINSSRNILISIEGEEDAVMAINNSLEECLSAIRPWYHILSRINFYIFFYLLLIVPLIIIILGITIGIIKLDSNQSLSPVIVIHSIFKGLLWGFTPPVFGYIFSWIQKTYFPMGSFAIGQGVKRNKDKEIIRTVIIIGFSLSLIAAIIAALIFAL